MIRIRFTDLDAKKRALGRLAGRFSFKSWATGEMLVPAEALGFLATESIPFQVEGPARMSKSLRRYEILLPLRFNDGQSVPDDLVAETFLEPSIAV